MYKKGNVLTNEGQYFSEDPMRTRRRAPNLLDFQVLGFQVHQTEKTDSGSEEKGTFVCIIKRVGIRKETLSM